VRFLDFLPLLVPVFHFECRVAKEKGQAPAPGLQILYWLRGQIIGPVATALTWLASQISLRIINAAMGYASAVIFPFAVRSASAQACIRVTFPDQMSDKRSLKQLHAAVIFRCFYAGEYHAFCGE
jgi:hypothetical protein